MVFSDCSQLWGRQNGGLLACSLCDDTCGADNGCGGDNDGDSCGGGCGGSDGGVHGISCSLKYG